jgi:hypothetical protein
MNGVPFDVVHQEHRHDVDSQRSHHVNLVEHETIAEEPNTDSKNAIAVQKAYFKKLVILGPIADHEQNEAVDVVAEVSDVVVPPAAVVVSHAQEDQYWK